MTSLEDPRWLAMRPAWRDQLLEKHRDINVWDDWYEPVYEVFERHCATCGVEVERMYFSGFWSQGDGACFDGRVADWHLFLKHVGETSPLIAAMAAADGLWNGWGFWSRHHGRYHDSCSVDFTFEMGDDNAIDPDIDPLRHAAFQVVIDGIVWDDLEKQYKAAFRELMDQLYKDLEAEYDHLTSDEEVATYILELDPDEITDPEADEQEVDSCALESIF